MDRVPDDVQIFPEIDGKPGPFICVNVQAAKAEAEAIVEELSVEVTRNALSRNPLRRRRTSVDYDAITEGVFNNTDHWDGGSATPRERARTMTTSRSGGSSGSTRAPGRSPIRATEFR
jgi:hypothetical protein